MPRIRYIKPEFSFDVELSRLSHAARLFYILSWTHMDRMGRAKDEPERLRALVFPYESGINVDDILNQLHPHHIRRYEADGRKYLQVNPEAWKKHQKPHVKEADSVIPPAPKHVLSTGSLVASTEQAALLIGMGIGMGNGENNRHGSPSAVVLQVSNSDRASDGFGDYRLPKNFGRYGGVYVTSLSIDDCESCLDMNPGPKVRAALEWRIAQKKAEMTPAQRKAA